MRDEQKDQVMSEAKKLLAIISDYRVKPTPEHIEDWLSQFDSTARLPIVTELTHILSKSYLSAKTTEDFLKGLISNPKLVGNDPASFWKGANFFNAQQGGHSQAELLDLFGTLLTSETSLKLKECGSQNGPIIYLDDLLLSGNRIVNDFRAWIPERGPKSSTVHAIFMGTHSGGSYYAHKAIPEMAGKADKKLNLNLWCVLRLENLSNSGAAADVYRLRTLPEDESTARYIQEHVEGDPTVMRPEKDSNKSKFFTSEKSRHFLEQTFWSTGLRIREIAHNLKDTHRPLGYTSTNSANKLGFGATVVTYRNCLNNCPLAYWVGDPWYPLFERKIN
ncbi:MAG TPA: hypothetical protein VMF56_12190 [Acidobacteriaceae bacterium]|nr:hypothetical protein [Acidobacteriaceae bacterium]